MIKGAAKTSFGNVRDDYDKSELLQFYRSRIERLESDYQEALTKVDELKVPHEQYHQLQWELQRRESEILKLQRSLSDAQTQLFDERKQLLRVVAENDDLKIQELKDRKKINFLMSLSSCTHDEITYLRDAIDKRLVKPGKPDEFKKTEPKEHDIESMQMRISSLVAQIDEQKRHAEETIAGLLRDRKTLLQEACIREEHDKKKVAELLDKMQRLRSLNRENTRELLHSKKSLHEREKRLVEDKYVLNEELQKTKTQFVAEQERLQKIEKTFEKTLEMKQNTVVAELEEQIVEYKRELKAAKDEIEKAESIQRKKIDAIQSKLLRLSQNHSNLKVRRKLEIEGFTSDIVALRNQIRTLEKVLLRFGTLEDRELALLSLADHAGKEISSMSSILKDLKGDLLRTEQTLRQITY